MDFFATALPALGDAFAMILTPSNVIYLIMGVVLGLSVGVFPGLGGIAGLSMLLPFIYGMDPVAGLALMVGLVAVIPTSDTFASVLMGIPGSSASQATVLDGFPLAKKGQAARALSAAFTSSLFGGLFGASILTVFVLVAQPIILAFGIPELLLLTLWGLSMVGVLAGTSLLKGLIAAGLGMMVGAIGEAPAQGSSRMDMESWYLQDGLALVIVGLGIFAIPEIITLLRQDKPISKVGVLGDGWRQGIKDWWVNKWLSIRCSSLGVIIGVIPGLGGSVVDWIAYGHTIQTSKDTSQFGKGDIRGVIGPESSNNAKEGGGLVPTLLFGIPGSGSMAVFIGGLILLGYEAGPQMISNDLDITYTIVWSLALANVVGAGLCIFLSGGIARLTAIPFPTLAPFLFMMIAFAAFQSKQTPWDLFALIGVGILGLYMRRFDWPRPAFLIGFVLADQAEVYTYQVTQIANVRLKLKGIEGLMDYLISITGIILLLIILVSVYLGAKNKSKLNSDNSLENTGSKRGPLIFTVALMAFMALYLQQTVSLNILIDKVFPVTMASITLFFSALLLLRMRLLPETAPIFADTERGEDQDSPRSMWSTLAWFVGLLSITLITGFIIAISLFMLVFFHKRAGLTWARSFNLTALALAILLGIAGVLNRDFPSGLLQEMFKLPWPFT